MESKFKTVINSHKDIPHVEIELRLGHIQGNRFDTNIGERDFKWMLRGFEKYKGWDSVKESTETVYYAGELRFSINDETDEENYIKKSKIKNIDHRFDRFDVRLGVATEEPLEIVEDDETEYERTIVKQRKSFIRKNVSIDMTTISGDPDDLDDEEEKQYQVELELLNVDTMTDDELSNSIHKVKDVMNMFK